MSHSFVRTAALAAVAGGCCSAASGAIQTYRFDMPEAPLAIFGAQWGADFLSPGNPGMVVDSRLHVEYTTGTILNDAADILFEIQLATESLPFWQVSGADLGWSGSGTFTADLSTLAFNEALIDVPPGSFRLWFARIINLDETGFLLDGQLTASYWEFDADVVPSPGTAAVATAAGVGLLRRRRSR